MFTVQHDGACLELDHQNSDSDSVKLIYDLKQAGYKRLMVVRVDFYFREEYQRQMTIFDIQELKNRLWRNRRSKPSIFKNCLGWIWGLEYTEECNYHCHCLFLFDADCVQADVYYGDQIGEYWVGPITHGKGCYRNDNRYKSSYQHCGIGRIHFDNPEQLYNLFHRVIPYLAKDDLQIRAAMALDAAATGFSTSRIRTFGYSNNLSFE